MPLAKAMIEAAGNSTQPTYIEDVFSTWLYTGNGSTQTITNGIDLAGEGGLVWCKIRNTSDAHALFDTARGFPNYLVSNATIAQNGYGAANTNDMQPTATGFSMANTSSASNSWNSSGNTFASWTFRKQPKFFDVVTFTSNSSGGATFSHNLQSVPGCVIVKSTANPEDWYVWHRGTTGGFGARVLFLNNTMAEFNTGYTTTATSTQVTISPVLGNLNAPYVAYLFAHNAGGFGDDGLQDVISCGGYNGTDAQLTVNLGWEPQYILLKQVTAGSATYGNWQIFDNMRGLNANLAYNNPPYLEANTSDAEGTGNPDGIAITSTGFRVDTSFSVGGYSYIYIAIRRGPMKTPTTGTSVFRPAFTGDTTSEVQAYLGKPVDLWAYAGTRSSPVNYWRDRLRGGGALETSSTSAEFGNAGQWYASNIGAGISGPYTNNTTQISWVFARAPGFFDEVCYTGTGANLAVNHNLGVAPEMMIVKRRDSSPGSSWATAHIGRGSPWATFNGFLYDTGPFDQYFAFYQNPTATQFFVGTTGGQGTSGATYVAYLFASCPGVSKVFNFTGNGSSQTINCGFTGGARFVMIKRTDSTGDWYVWDSARGIVSGNDPRLSLNTTAAEVTTDDSVDTDSTGFVVNQLSATNVNVNGASYIGLAIA